MNFEQYHMYAIFVKRKLNFGHTYSNGKDWQPCHPK